MKELFTIPTDKEIEMMVSDGIIPLRAKIAWYLYKFYDKVF